MESERTCRECGKTIPPDAGQDFCPHCLLALALETGGADSYGETPSAGQPAPPRFMPVPGEAFGGYQIERLLGTGGMGQVYEAVQVSTGRRLALKVMSEAMTSEHDRKRFLREGRVAASVNHPNVVYIYGSEEIEGAPVITMELVRGGTLKDRLSREGALPAAEAVDAALQVIAGLEAVHAAGVLHRDVKPGNCFVEPDGTVKIGDFGLSVTTQPSADPLRTAATTTLGTPAYASPEQLRREELDVRSDIYSLGATLYHLLTGRAPFPGADPVKVISDVLTKEPEAPRAVRREIPAVLSRIVLRCLAKNQKARFQSYGELREALLPFRSGEPLPAKPGIRFLAGLIDGFLVRLPARLVLAGWVLFFSSEQSNAERDQVLFGWCTWLVSLLSGLLCCGVAEGLWGAGPGKAICGLRVVGPNRQVPNLKRALLRYLIFSTFTHLPGFLYAVFLALHKMGSPQTSWSQVLTSAPNTYWSQLLLGYLVFCALFISMRASNGYAALQDLLSDTRVIARPRHQARPTLSMSRLVKSCTEACPPENGGARSEEASSCPGTIGLYEIRGSLWGHDDEELLLGFDPLLRREVWIHLRPAEMEPVPEVRRNLGRPARLHWLNGGRAAARHWDAYEAIEGAPFLSVIKCPQPWNAVRFWLADLAEELAAVLAVRGTSPCLALEHIWISVSGRALLLDFLAPGLGAAVVPTATRPLAGVAEMQQFLCVFARAALEGRTSELSTPLPHQSRTQPVTFFDFRRLRHALAVPVRLPEVPLPMHSQAFLSALQRQSFDEGTGILRQLRPLVSRPATVTCGRRVASLALLLTCCVSTELSVVQSALRDVVRLERWFSSRYPNRPSLRAGVWLYYGYRPVIKVDRWSRRPSGLGLVCYSNVLPLKPGVQEALEVYLRYHFSDLLTNDLFWPKLLMEKGEWNIFRKELHTATANASPPTLTEIKGAARIVTALLREERGARETALVYSCLQRLRNTLIILGAVEVLGIVLFGQSLLLSLFDLTLIKPDGQLAARSRLLLRWLAVWPPVIAVVLLQERMMLKLVLPHQLGSDGSGPYYLLGVFQPMTPSVLVTITLLGLVLAGVMVYAVKHPEQGLSDLAAGTWLVRR